MSSSKSKIEWPNKMISFSKKGDSWLEAAKEAGISIPTGCLNGSCGACEIEVNGEVIRACIAEVPEDLSATLRVEFSYDPFW